MQSTLRDDIRVSWTAELFSLSEIVVGGVLSLPLAYKDVVPKHLTQPSISVLTLVISWVCLTVFSQDNVNNQHEMV